MKNFLKGKLGTIIILVFTVILAGVAIFTALRLYQLRSQPVAPNVPSSIPRAQEVTPGACTLSFTLTPTTGVVCTNKTAYEDVASNTPGVYDLSATNLLPNNATVSAGQKVVYVVKPGPVNVTKNITITDTLPTFLTFVDSDTVCAYNATTRTISCTLTGTNAQAAFRASVNANATGTITNTASVTGQGDQASSCFVTVKMPGATPTPTATPTETPTPSGTPNSCGGTCGSNTNCGGGLYCYTTLGLCRNPSCPTQSDCNCPGTSTPAPTPGRTGTPAPTPTPTVPTLPVSGTDWPTILGAGIGLFVIIGSLLLAL